MSRVTYSQSARRDLLQIIETIAEDDPRAARAFEWRLRHHCSLLAATPQMGRQRPEIGIDVRSLVRGSYLIFIDGCLRRIGLKFSGYGTEGGGCLAWILIRKTIDDSYFCGAKREHNVRRY